MSEPRNSQVRVLIVDDRRDITEILKALLVRSGYAVETAEDGTSALEIVRRFAPHALISDLGLTGGMNGFALAEAVRNDRSIRAPYLIAVTGRDDDDYRKRAAEAGFRQFLVKPAEVQQLLTILSRLEAGEPTSGFDSQSVSQ